MIRSPASSGHVSFLHCRKTGRRVKGFIVAGDSSSTSSHFRTTGDALAPASHYCGSKHLPPRKTALVEESVKRRNWRQPDEDGVAGQLLPRNRAPVPATTGHMIRLFGRLVCVRPRNAGVRHLRCGVHGQPQATRPWAYVVGHLGTFGLRGARAAATPQLPRGWGRSHRVDALRKRYAHERAPLDRA
jgi:hypothetical protein